MESVERQTGKRPSDLDTADCPVDCWHVWAWFQDLASSRDGEQINKPLTYRELHAWAQLTGVQPTPDEIELIRLADRIVLDVIAEHRSTTKKG